jgi:3-oxoacyl-[acyl-carrier protein] reductase
MSIQAGADRRVAVVTGGSGAIGGAIAARLAPDHTVVVLDRHGDVTVDLGDPDAVLATSARTSGGGGEFSIWRIRTRLRRPR